MSSELDAMVGRLAGELAGMVDADGELVPATVLHADVIEDVDALGRPTGEADR